MANSPRPVALPLARLSAQEAIDRVVLEIVVLLVMHRYRYLSPLNSI